MGAILSRYIPYNIFLFIKRQWNFSILPILSGEEPNLCLLLRDKIKAEGPITVADYMKECLYNPKGGYYWRDEVLGEKGDYTTSPEMCQVFGEMIGIWFLNEWAKCGSPRPFQIVELGPGTGSMLRDMLRVMQQFTEVCEIAIYIVEVCPRLYLQQSQKLCSKSELVKNEPFYQYGHGQYGNPIKWYGHLDDVPKGEFTLFVAHEFFDSLPIHKFEKTDNGYKEMLIDIDHENEDKFRFVLSEEETPTSKVLSASKESRQHVERSTEGILTVKAIAHRIELYGGVALLADYGHVGESVDTFRAFRNHKLHDPLEEPGMADLTTDVNFLDLKKAAINGNKVLVFGPVTQRRFLDRIECEERFKQLVERSKTLLNGKDWKEQLEKCYDMYTNVDKMGERFKFLAIVPKNIEVLLRKYPLCGFEKQEF